MADEEGDTLRLRTLGLDDAALLPAAAELVSRFCEYGPRKTLCLQKE